MPVCRPLLSVTVAFGLLILGNDAHARQLVGWNAPDNRVSVADLPATDPLARVARSVGLVITSYPEPSPGQLPDLTETGSGVLVAPCILLTARHVLGTAPLDRNNNRSIQVTFLTPGQGVRRSTVTLGAVVAAAGGGTARWTNRSVNEDWALLELSGVPPQVPHVPPDRVDCCSPQQALQVALAGFPADHYDPLEPEPWVDPDCRVTERLANRILTTSCIATSGNSGGPLFVESSNGWRVGGILTRASPPDSLGRATRADNFVLPLTGFLRRQIDTVWRASACAPQPPPAFVPAVPTTAPQTPRRDEGRSPPAPSRLPGPQLPWPLQLPPLLGPLLQPAPFRS